MDEIGVLIKKYIFPFLITLSGILLLITAFSSTGNISQSGTFKLGAFVVFAMGIVTYLYIQEIITKSQHIIILVVMLLSCMSLGFSTYSSVSTTIGHIELKKEKDIHIKQGLRDIEVIQLEYKKKYGWYSDDFSELKRFLLDDSVYSISTRGIVPDYKVTEEHAMILGYDPIQDYIQMESYDEKEALKCGLLSKDTSWLNVMSKLFPTTLDTSGNRIYEFDINSFHKVPMSEEENKIFTLKANILESSDDLTYEVLLFNLGSDKHFISANLIDFNGNDTAFYGKDIKGLIVKDSIHQISSLEINDIVSDINGISYNTPSGVLELLKSLNKKDTLSFNILRGNNPMTIKLTQKDILPVASRAAWSDLEDLLEYNLLPSLYEPNKFDQFFIGKYMVVKEDEFSSPKLDLGKFRNFLANRNIDTTSISFEYTKAEKSEFYSLTNSENEFYLFSKVGTPVFTAFDPSPYDPLNERDTLITGSMTEVKTSGNWK